MFPQSPLARPRIHGRHVISSQNNQTVKHIYKQTNNVNQMKATDSQISNVWDMSNWFTDLLGRDLRARRRELQWNGDAPKGYSCKDNTPLEPLYLAASASDSYLKAPSIRYISPDSPAHYFSSSFPPFPPTFSVTIKSSMKRKSQIEAQPKLHRRR